MNEGTNACTRLNNVVSRECVCLLVLACLFVCLFGGTDHEPMMWWSAGD
jgi:hypothetical protein